MVAKIKKKKIVKYQSVPALVTLSKDFLSTLDNKTRSKINSIKANVINLPKKKNIVTLKDKKAFNLLQKHANSMGFYVELHCAGKDDDVACNGLIMMQLYKEKRKYFTYFFCAECKREWRLEKENK